MKLGLFLATQWQADHPLQLEIPNLCEQVRVARDNGFSSIWVGQHFVSGPLQMLQMAPLIARLAAEAPGLTFGSAVVLLPMLNPVAVAEEAATLHWITGGRYVLGAGIGYRDEEFRALGVPRQERAARFEESVDVIRKLFRDRQVAHAGRFYDVDGLGASIRPAAGDLPIWIGGQVDAAIRRAALRGDAWLPAPTQRFPSLVRAMALYRSTRLDSGLTLPEEQPLIRECFVAPTRAAAVASCRDALMSKYASYAAWGETGARPAKAEPADFDSLARDQFIIGDEAHAIDEVGRHRDALGVNHLIVRMQWPGLKQMETLASIESMGRVLARV